MREYRCIIIFMKANKVSKILSLMMYALFSVLLLFGIFACIFDLSHKSYILAFVVAAVLFAVYIRTHDTLPVLENVYILTFLCLVLHALWIVMCPLEIAGDYLIFWKYATQLACNTGTATMEYVAMFPHIFGYSYFISRFMSIFGDLEIIPPILNVLLTTGSGLIIWTLVKDIYGKRQAGIAYILWIICPSKIIYNSMVLSEPYYTNLLLIFILIVEKVSLSEKRGIWFLGILGGLILRLVNTARPVAVIPIIALVIWILLLNGFKKKFIPFFVLLLLVYIPTGTLWNNFMAKNLWEEPATGVPGYNVYVGLDSEHGGTHNEEDIDRLFDYYYGKHLSAPDAQQQMLDDAIEMVKSGKTDFASLIPNKFKSLLGNDEGGAFYASDALSNGVYSLLCIISNIWYYFIILSAIAGAFNTVKRGEMNVLQLAPLYTIGLILAQMLVEVSGRYHYSIIPMLIITASAYRKEKI